jgi:DNA-binding IclR family transcriptional regulator
MEPLLVSRAVMDEYAVRILIGTSPSAASALELSLRLGIPIAACYRRIRELETMGLLVRDGEVHSRNGKDRQLYRSRLRAVTVAFEDGRLRARVELLATKAGEAASASEETWGPKPSEPQPGARPREVL